MTVSVRDARGTARDREWIESVYRDYLDDADAFVGHVRDGAPGRKLFVVAHSQGGLIATLWALAAPRPVSGFVLSSPFFRLKLQPPRLKLLLARVVGGIIPEEDAARLRSAGVKRVYTPKDFDLTRIMGEIVDVVAESPPAA